MSGFLRTKFGLSVILAVCCPLLLVAFSKQDDKAAVDLDTYKACMAASVLDVSDLQDFFLEQRDEYLAVIPPDPDFILRQYGYPSLLPFTPKSFPPEFVENLSAVYENSVPVYPITILEDPSTRETVFLNADGKEIYALRAVPGYNPYAYVEGRYPNLFSGYYAWETSDYLKRLYDPARIQIQVTLISAYDVEAYLYAQSKISEAAAELAAFSEEGGGGIMLLFSEEWTNHLWLSINGPPQNVWTGMEVIVHLPDGFTNGIEVYYVDIPTNQLFLGVASAWALGWTNNQTAGTNQVAWTDFGATNTDLRYYVAGNADIQSDADGLSDARERYIYHSNPNLIDSDGDGFVDSWDGLFSTNSYTNGVDADADGYVDGEQDHGTQAGLADTDGDGLVDSADGHVGTNDYPAGVDIDGGGFVDGEMDYGTSPTNYDTDADGLVDALDGRVSTATYPAGADADADNFVDGEMDFGTSPTNSDSDADGMPDGWEVRHGLNPLFDDSTNNPDGDGLTNLEEYQAGTDPNLTDSDGDGVADDLDANPASYTDSEPDGLPDDWEVFWFGNLDQIGTDNPDGDGLSNAEEFAQGTDPTTPDQIDTNNTTGLTVFLPLQ